QFAPPLIERLTVIAFAKSFDWSNAKAMKYATEPSELNATQGSDARWSGVRLLTEAPGPEHGEQGGASGTRVADAPVLVDRHADRDRRRLDVRARRVHVIETGPG